MQWDVFCRVIDNHGDLGVCWRLSCHLAAHGHRVRLWVDQASDLQWMAPEGNPGVSVHPWPHEADLAWPDAPQPADSSMANGAQVQHLPQATTTVPPAPNMLHGVIEAFGCQLPAGVQATLARMSPPPVWINLEYLSAEPHVARLHGLPSPVMSGPARGMQKWFFYPGFTAQTGGLLHPMPWGHPAQTQAHAPALVDAPDDSTPGHARPAALRVLLFCYEPASLNNWLTAWADGQVRVDVSVCAGRASQAVQAWLDQRGLRSSGALRITQLPWVSQTQFDALLANHDLNLVRGEDSLVRALWAGQALVWQIYPQDDGVHHAKLAAFLSTLGAPAEVVQAHLAWNADTAQAPPVFDRSHLAATRQWARATRRSLLAQADLAQQLIDFAQRHSALPGAQG